MAAIYMMPGDSFSTFDSLASAYQRNLLVEFARQIQYLMYLTRVAYRYSGTDRNRYSFRKEPVFTRFVENRY